MTKAEILAELPRLHHEDLIEVQAKVEELIGNGWTDGGELSDADKAELEASLARFQASPVTEPWEVVKARILSELK